eukprot:2229707-Prymnesium_polylepis.1
MTPRHSALRREQTALPPSRRLCRRTAAQAATSQRASRLERAGLRRQDAFEPIYCNIPTAPGRLAALRKPVVSHGTHVPRGPFSSPLYSLRINFKGRHYDRSKEFRERASLPSFAE